MILTYDEAVEQLHLAVKLKGEDHVAERCFIFEGGQNAVGDYTERREDWVTPKTPMCIVGQVIYQLVGHETFQYVSGGFVAGPLASVLIQAEPRTVSLLEEAQRYQDGGAGTYNAKQPWGKAVEFAIKEVPNV